MKQKKTEYEKGFYDGMIKCLEHITIGEPDEMFDRMHKLLDKLESKKG